MVKEAEGVILNVDDNVGARYAKTRVLRLAGFEVLEAANGTDALVMVRSARPDLVLLDMKLPDINGLEVCRLIKSDPETASVIVLQTSASLTGLEDKLRGLQGGADNYLSAPIEAPELIANVNALLRLRRVQNRLSESEERFRQMAESIHDVFWMFDAKDMALSYVSPAYYTLWRRPVDQLMAAPRDWLDAVHGDDREHVVTAFEQVSETGHYDIEFRIVRRQQRHDNEQGQDDSLLWLRDRCYAINDERGNLLRIARITSDISGRKSAEERTLYQSRHDSLTGLVNRRLFHERLHQAIADARGTAVSVEVMFIDLDHFKEVNDSLGHDIGDALLRDVAARLTGCVRTTDLVARLGGDEFGILRRYAETDAQRAAPAALLAADMIALLSTPFRIQQHDIVIGASIGISTYPGDTQDPQQLVRNADLAMYRAKSEGRSSYRVYLDSMDAEARRQRDIEEGLRRALDRHELRLHYQPQHSLETGVLTGVEALLRWKDSGISDVTMSELFGIADRTGLVLPLGEWVFRTVCKQIAEWKQAGRPALRMAVNVTPTQMRHRTFLQTVDQILSENGLDYSCLELEITEQTLMENNQTNIVVLQALKNRGLFISVDDFGTGFSSMSYLKHFPVDALKIDQMFVAGLPDNRQDGAIARAIIGMAHSLGMQVIAEGIETEAQAFYLRDAGCDSGQGYYYARPLPAEEFATRYLC